MAMDDDLVEHDWYSNETATFGDRLADARMAVGLTQEELARKIGVKTSTLDGWENDLNEPRVHRLSILAGMLNVTLRWLMTGEGEGLARPMPEADLPQDIHAMMSEMRDLQGEMVRQAERLGRLQKRLRKALDAST